MMLLTTAVFAHRTVICPKPVQIINNQYDSYYNCDCQADAYKEQDRSAMAAISSVELNPDHQGWSVGIGASSFAGTAAGAIGVMYGQDNVGINVKAYDAEGGYNGASVGITFGF